MSEPVTSDISVTRVGTSVRNKKSIYTATKVTKTQSNPPQYKTEIVRYSDAKKSNPVVIGERDSKTGKISFNDSASSTEQKYSASLGKTSSGQIKSIAGSVTSNAADKAALNASAGQSNQALGSGVSTQQQGGRVIKGQGGRPLGSTTQRGGGVNSSANGGADNKATEKPQVPPGEPKPGTRNAGFPHLVFPEGLASVDRDVLKIDMLQYIASGFGTGQGGLGSGKGRDDLWTKKMIGSVTLPVPGGISDTNAVDWGSGTMNPIQAAAANIALETLQKGFAKGADVAVDTLGKVKDAGPDVKKGIASLIAGSATQIGKQALQRGEGMVLNPNMEVLFNGPQLRTFGFSFKLSPRSQREAQTVVKIIKFFKQGMSPIRSKSNFYLKAPHTFRLKYLDRAGGSEQKYLNKFKECALQNATVQYTPDGNYNTFVDGVMTSYSLQLTFAELTPVFNDDYGNGSFDASIGY